MSPEEGVTFIWDAVDEATTYVLQIGTSSGVYDVYDTDVGNILTKTVNLPGGVYYSRVVPWAGALPLTPTDEQVVLV